MTDLDRVIVLAGGLSPERDVSLRSGHQVAQALRDVGVDAVVSDLNADLLALLAADAPDAVFPVLHGVSGEDGTLYEVLRLAGLPYVGAEPAACRLAFDKPVAKALLTRAGLTTPPSLTLPRQAFGDLGAVRLADLVVRRLGLPLCVKPRAGGSAFGVSRVDAPADLAEALMAAFGYHDEALIERWITGTEVAVGVIDLAGEPVALPPVEIVPDSGRYDYTARYTAGATEFFSPARLSTSDTQAVAAAGLAAHRALGLRDLSRTDIVLSDGVPYILETNVAPGMTATSTFPMALRVADRDFGLVCRELAAQAAARGSFPA